MADIIDLTKIKESRGKGGEDLDFKKQLDKIMTNCSLLLDLSEDISKTLSLPNEYTSANYHLHQRLIWNSLKFYYNEIHHEYIHKVIDMMIITMNYDEIDLFSSKTKFKDSKLKQVMKILIKHNDNIKLVVENIIKETNGYDEETIKTWNRVLRDLVPFGLVTRVLKLCENPKIIHEPSFVYVVWEVIRTYFSMFNNILMVAVFRNRIDIYDICYPYAIEVNRFSYLKYSISLLENGWSKP